MQKKIPFTTPVSGSGAVKERWGFQGTVKLQPSDLKTATLWGK